MRQVFIDPIAFRRIKNEVRRYSYQETGGILVGYATRDTVMITNVSGPGPFAIHRRQSLKLDDRFCRLEYLKFKKRNKKLKYLGDWHCHPSNILKPSKRDIVTYLRKKQTHYNTDSPLMMITGTCPPIRVNIFTRVKNQMISFTPKLM